MATKPKAPAQSKILDKKTVPVKTPAKPTPKAPAKKAKAAPVKPENGGKEVSGKPTSIKEVAKAAKPAVKAPEKKAPAKKATVKKAVKTAAPAAEAEDKRSVGRPSKYRPEYAAMLIQYFDSLSVPWTEQRLNTAGGGEKIEMVPCRFPNFARFAANIGVSRDTIHHWATEKDKDGHPVNAEFSDAYARARAIQEAVLLEGSMAGVFESRMAGLAAKNLIGWADKLEQTVDDVTGFSPEEKADLERSYNEAKLSGVWVQQRADMKARKKALNDD